MVSALDSGASGPGSSPGRGHCDVFLGNTLYRKHRRISRTFLLKIFGSNRVCGLSARTSRHHAVNLHKLTSLTKILKSV